MELDVNLNNIMFFCKSIIAHTIFTTYRPMFPNEGTLYYDYLLDSFYLYADEQWVEASG